jgi:hypothetical protein
MLSFVIIVSGVRGGKTDVADAAMLIENTITSDNTNAKTFFIEILLLICPMYIFEH